NPPLAALLLALGISEKPADETAALSAALAAAKTLQDTLASLQTNVAALTARADTPDPGKFAPIATLTALQSEHAALQAQLAALTAKTAAAELDQVIESARTAGKITPALESWARTYGSKDLAGLTAYLSSAPVIVPPGTQTGGKSPAGGSGKRRQAARHHRRQGRCRGSPELPDPAGAGRHHCRHRRRRRPRPHHHRSPMMANEVLTKAFLAGAAINARRIVKFDTTDGTVIQAAAAADLSVGVCGEVGPASGERCDVVLQGIADVDFGGTVTRGAMVTADANGKAVAAASTNRTIGIALVSAVSGDIAPVLIAPSVM
ncbi:MAG TPA: DUF2190 family protein, partial [Caulobacter sp.]|nr:DUF2190 family protein [Caulobacter sp.]